MVVPNVDRLETKEIQMAGRYTDHGVSSGQPGAAGRLTPEHLGFDDLTELPVIRAVVPSAVNQMPYLLFHCPTGFA